MNTKRDLTWAALVIVVFCLLFTVADVQGSVSLQETPTPELDFEVVVPLVQKAHIELTPTPTITPRPPPTPIPTCDCSGDIYNCTDFTTQAAAQACYDYCMQEVGYDVHRLDRDDDGVACEELP